MIRNTAAQMADALAKGETTSVELTQAHLDRIAAVDGQVKAFLHVDSAGALAQAKDVEQVNRTLKKLSKITLSLEFKPSSNKSKQKFLNCAGDGFTKKPLTSFCLAIMISAVPLSLDSGL